MKKFDLVRSFLYVPAYNEKYIYSALNSEADVIILDLEDSVPYSQKMEARENILRATPMLENFNGHVIIRINSLEDKEQILKDLSFINASFIDGLMLPKINIANDLVVYEQMIEKQLGKNNLYFIPLIETAFIMLNLEEIAKYPKVKGLAFGGEDYITDLHGKHGKSTTIFEYARIQIIIAARSYNKIAVDTPFLALDDHVGFMNAIENASELGFDGKQCIHPSQIQRLNKALTPNKEEYRQALKILTKIDEAQENGQGVIIFNGKMIGPPMLKRAQNLIKQYELIQNKKNYIKRGQ